MPPGLRLRNKKAASGAACIAMYARTAPCCPRRCSERVTTFGRWFWPNVRVLWFSSLLRKCQNMGYSVVALSWFKGFISRLLRFLLAILFQIRTFVQACSKHWKYSAELRRHIDLWQQRYEKILKFVLHLNKIFPIFPFQMFALCRKPVVWVLVVCHLACKVRYSL